MAPDTRKNYVTEYRSNPNSTAGGGWVRDSYGRWWEIVDGFESSGTGTASPFRAKLRSDGSGRQWIE